MLLKMDELVLLECRLTPFTLSHSLTDTLLSHTLLQTLCCPTNGGERAAGVCSCEQLVYVAVCICLQLVYEAGVYSCVHGASVQLM